MELHVLGLIGGMSIFGLKTKYDFAPESGARLPFVAPNNAL